MMQQILWPEPGFVIPVTSTPQVTPLLPTRSLPGIIANLAVFPNNFSAGPAPTNLIIQEFSDDVAAFLTWQCTWGPPGAMPLASGLWTPPADPPEVGPFGAVNRFYRIFTNQGTLDLIAQVLFEDTPGHTELTMDWVDPV